ncbi:MAG: flavin reductase family protein [Rhodospirillales bacterium]|nr:flavin reductase family protein [Rhodospirillales bacterium]
MFWKTSEPHGLPHNPFKSCVVPRPIGWISSISADGHINLAPYSFFNGLAGEPPLVMFSNNGSPQKAAKDTLRNVEATGEFVCNMATWDLRDKMNASSAPVDADTNEFEIAGLEMAPSELVKPPRVKDAPIHMECVYVDTMELPCETPGGRNVLVVGRVIGIHIKDAYMTDGMVDIERIRPLARMGYQDYTAVEKVFTLVRPEK